MDSERFDRIARTWATTSRRRVLAGLATALGATLPLALGATGADAKKKRRGKRKRPPTAPPPDGCPDECCAHTDCAPAEQCRGGKCQPIIGGG